MTPERRAEIEQTSLGPGVEGYIRAKVILELLAEIDRLTDENQQYQTLYVTRTAYESVKEHRDEKQAEIDRLTAENARLRRHQVEGGRTLQELHSVIRQLAAELERRSKA